MTIPTLHFIVCEDEEFGNLNVLEEKDYNVMDNLIKKIKDEELYLEWKRGDVIKIKHSANQPDDEFYRNDNLFLWTGYGLMEPYNFGPNSTYGSNCIYYEIISGPKPEFKESLPSQPDDYGFLPNEFLLGVDYLYGDYFSLIAHNNYQYADFSNPDMKYEITHEEEFLDYFIYTCKYDGNEILILTEDENINQLILYDSNIENIYDIIGDDDKNNAITNKTKEFNVDNILFNIKSL